MLQGLESYRISRMLEYHSRGAYDRRKGSNMVNLHGHSAGSALFLPDCVTDNPWLYDHIISVDKSLENLITLTNMPNVYTYNTKRYEVLWLTFMREQLNLSTAKLVVAHGSSAEALLRYLESDPLMCCILVDCSDIYTAGERHGRDYRFSKIMINCKNITLVSTSPKSQEECIKLQEGLKYISPDIYHFDCTTNIKKQNMIILTNTTIMDSYNNSYILFLNKLISTINSKL